MDFLFQARKRLRIIRNMKDTMQAIQAWDAAGLRSAEAILVGVQHSSPRQAGARLAVNEKGERVGAVSMGCVESDLHEHLLQLLHGEGPARMIHYGASFGATLEVGLSCGGEIDVWIRRHDPTCTAWKSLGSLKTDSRALLLTRLNADSTQLFWVQGDPAPSKEMEEALEFVWMRGGTQKIMANEQAWFAEMIAPVPLLLIVGASPIAVALCDLASRTGFRVSIIDPRRDFARETLFPAAERVIHAWPEEGLAEAGMDAHSFVAVLAHDAKLDLPALEAALRTSCRYIGLLGSKGTQAKRHEMLAEAGVSPEKLATIHGPIGIKSMGALEPSEIAVSILAELIMVRRGAKA